MTVTTAREDAVERFVMDLDRGRIREFADSTNATHRAYREADRPVVPPVYLCFEGAEADAAAGDTTVAAEQDCRFFGPPPRAGDRLTALSWGGADDRVTEYRDADGLLVADSWTHGPRGSADAVAAGQLANYATDWLGPDRVRRFRTRFTGPVPAGQSLHCTGEVVAEYVTDGEPRVDVALTAINPDGVVAARAWATFAVTD
ncbi:hypothetical protein [Rhodococcus kronopolitis]|uniref:N-terminal of MaoC-like dehydratase domain-containing protein n=1 Tax=Rhodococcus kronopolitis TaxID=1460226 RepID=A0ABV9FP53_9NOCA